MRFAERRHDGPVHLAILASVVSVVDEGTRGTRRRGLVRALLLAVAFVALYAVSNLTAFGQTLENSWARRYDVDATLGHELDFAGFVPPFNYDIEILVIGVGAACVIALVRRRWSELLVVAVAMPLVVFGTHVFKEVAGRPELVPSLDTATSYPSGHAGIALVVSAALVVVLPARALRWAGPVLGCWCLLVIGGLQAEGQHRASEVIGSGLWTATVLVAVQALVGRGDAQVGRSLPSRRSPRPIRTSAVVTVVVAVIVAVAGGWCPLWWCTLVYAGAALLATWLTWTAALGARTPTLGRTSSPGTGRR